MTRSLVRLALHRCDNLRSVAASNSEVVVQMRNRTRVLLSIVAMTSALLASVTLSGCGGEKTETETSPQIQQAMALLAQPDLSALSDAENELVVSALREALGKAGKVHIKSTLEEQDISFASDGRVAAMREFGTAEHQPPEFATPEVSPSETILLYDGPPASFCDGREDPTLVMVREYVFAFGQWTVSARAIPPDEVPFGSLFSSMDLSVAKDAGFSDEQGRRLRGFSVPFPQPGDPEATATVWVDLADGLIRRVSTPIPGLAGSSYPFTLDYDVSTEIEVPSEPAPPDCVPVESTG